VSHSLCVTDFNLRLSILLVYFYAFFLLSVCFFFLLLELKFLINYDFSILYEIMSFLRGDQPIAYLFQKISRPEVYSWFLTKLALLEDPTDPYELHRFANYYEEEKIRQF